MSCLPLVNPLDSVYPNQKFTQMSFQIRFRSIEISEKSESEEIFQKIMTQMKAFSVK